MASSLFPEICILPDTHFIWQVRERMLYLKKQKGHIQMVFLPKVMCPCLTLYFRKMLLKNNRYFVL